MATNDQEREMSPGSEEDRSSRRRLEQDDEIA
jgi:hypothetical protein